MDSEALGKARASPDQAKPNQHASQAANQGAGAVFTLNQRAGSRSQLAVVGCWVTETQACVALGSMSWKLAHVCSNWPSNGSTGSELGSQEPLCWNGFCQRPLMDSNHRPAA